MTTAAEVTEETAPAEAPTAVSAELAVRPPSRLSLSARLQYARALADSYLLPEQYRRQPANVLFAIEYGEMLGIPAIAAITGIHVIDGKPTASAGLISALVRHAGHKLRVGYDAQKMTGWAEIVRSDDPSYTFRSEWDLDRAVTAELCTIGKDGKPYAVDSKGKSKPWRKFYPSMVKHRAVTEAARDACEEVLFGLHYTPEELGAEVDEEGRVIGGVIVVDEMPDDTAEVEAALRVIPGIGMDACRKMWRETKAALTDGRMTDAGSGRVLAALTARMEALASPAGSVSASPGGTGPGEAADAEIVDAEIVDDGAEAVGLDPEDPWAPKVEELASDDDARAALDEAGGLLAAGDIDAARLAAIEAAILARFPGAQNAPAVAA